MMTVLEYAEDIGKTVEEVLRKCKELNIDAIVESDLLDEDAITDLDNTLNADAVVEEKQEEIVEELPDNVVKKEKLKKKPAYQTKKKH